jgi:hypothetical protein
VSKNFEEIKMTNISSSWNLTQIFEEANLAEWICEDIQWDIKKEYTGEIIAWKKIEDDRFIYLDYIITVFEQNNEYAFVRLSKRKGTRWIPHILIDHPAYTSTVEFKHKPTQTEIIKYLQNAM